MPQFYIDPDISRASTIDSSFYTSQHYFDLCREKLFSRSWQLIGDSDQVSEPGSAWPFTVLEGFLDEPLVLTRDKNNQIRCLSNVCTHRGNILVYEPCKLHGLVCKYHGRRFSLDGKFLSMPEFKEVKNFPEKSDNLHELKLFQWGKLLFTALHPEINAEEIFGDIMKRLYWFPMDKLKLDASKSKEYSLSANWALYCENYLEGFHIPFVHAGLNEVLDFGEYTTDLYRYSNVQVGVAKDGEACFDLPKDAPDYGKNIAGYYFWAFPNTMLNFYPWGISVNIIKPVSVSETRVTYLTYVCDESRLGSGAGNNLHDVEMEDEEVVENVQKGVRSRFYNKGRYSVNREQGTHHFHTLLAEFMNGGRQAPAN